MYIYSLRKSADKTGTGERGMTKKKKSHYIVSLHFALHDISRTILLADLLSSS